MINRDHLFHRGQQSWNKGTGGCKRGHDPSLYVPMPGSGVYVCLGCKRENCAKYRSKNRKTINLNNRVGRYEITIEDYENMFTLQNGCCAICGIPIKKENCRIDHSHETGKVRGLLCISCNTGIGLMQDSPLVLMKAFEYLNKYV